MTDPVSLPVADTVRRRLEIEDRQDTVRLGLALSANIAAFPALIWDALTDPARLETWYGAVDGDLVEGGRFHLGSGAVGSILEVEAPHKLSLTWEVDGSVDPLLLRVDPEDDGTSRVSIHHTALMDRAVFDEFGPGAVAIGWEIALQALRSEIEGGTAPTRAWLDSEEGQAQLRAWSIRWAAEAVAAGVDEDSARHGEDAITSAHRPAPAAS